LAAGEIGIETNILLKKNKNKRLVENNYEPFHAISSSLLALYVQNIFTVLKKP